MIEIGSKGNTTAGIVFDPGACSALFILYQAGFEDKFLQTSS